MNFSSFQTSSVDMLYVGGDPGKKGVNKLIRKNGEVISLGGKAKVDIQPWVGF